MTINIDEISDREHNERLSNALRGYLGKIESIKNLMRDGKIIVAHEKLQGVGDGLSFLLGLTQRRAEHGPKAESQETVVNEAPANS